MTSLQASSIPGHDCKCSLAQLQRSVLFFAVATRSPPERAAEISPDAAVTSCTSRCCTSQKESHPSLYRCLFWPGAQHLRPSGGHSIPSPSAAGHAQASSTHDAWPQRRPSDHGPGRTASRGACAGPRGGSGLCCGPVMVAHAAADVVTRCCCDVLLQMVRLDSRPEAFSGIAAVDRGEDDAPTSPQ